MTPDPYENQLSEEDQAALNSAAEEMLSGWGEVVEDDEEEPNAA